MTEVPQWSEALSVGHPTLDDHHRRLFELAGQAFAIRDANAAGAMLDELLRYTVYHFAEEERLMAAADYPFIELHRDAHRGIALRLEDMVETAAQRPQEELWAEIAVFLSNWLVHHIEIEDFEYREVLAAASR